MLLWPTFFIHTEMLPVERVVADWERKAVLAPFYSLTSLYKHAKARHRLPVRVRQILSKYEMKRMALAIFVPNLAGIHQPVLKLYQTADHPALSPVLGGSPWRLSLARDSRGFWLHHVANRPGGGVGGMLWVWLGLAQAPLPTKEFLPFLLFCFVLWSYMTSGSCYWFETFIITPSIYFM